MPNQSYTVRTFSKKKKKKKKTGVSLEKGTYRHRLMPYALGNPLSM